MYFIVINSWLADYETFFHSEYPWNERNNLNVYYPHWESYNIYKDKEKITTINR